ncbi:unnamed protein product [Orchesella dallaii]|uniref:Phorbol-ester/DAG-type domain-containing protein n=1 Tax=Orchesella dallaii TaxID=48710 RepID=A0ABP1QKH0_9HEXA
MDMDDADQDSLLWSSDDTKSNDLSILTATTDLEENYFASPIGDSSLQTVEAVEDAERHVKALILNTEGESDERLKLVRRLIELRIRLQEIKDTQDESGGSHACDELRIVNGHHFVLQGHLSGGGGLFGGIVNSTVRSYDGCNRCGGMIWSLIQSWYRCKGCFYQTHQKCLNKIIRSCPVHLISSETQYISLICPEVGLPAQKYKCEECKAHFTLKNAWMEPRRCDYNGKYYCPQCHKNLMMPIPARIFHNWDFEERKVSEATRQLLSLMLRKPNIHLEDINSKLFSFVEDLNAVKRIREEIIIIKDYFRTCREATNQKLLWRLEEKHHFVETSHMYSLQDLLDVNNGSLLPYLQKVHDDFLTHIKGDGTPNSECPTCMGKGFICEICENRHIIFPFDTAIHQCTGCHAVFHNICFAKRDSCPKCIRRTKRSSVSPV